MECYFMEANRRARMIEEKLPNGWIRTKSSLPHEHQIVAYRNPRGGYYVGWRYGNDWYEQNGYATPTPDEYLPMPYADEWVEYDEHKLNEVLNIAQDKDGAPRMVTASKKVFDTFQKAQKNNTNNP